MGLYPGSWTQSAGASEYDWPVAASSYDIPIRPAPVNETQPWQGYVHPQPCGHVTQPSAEYGFVAADPSPAQPQPADAYSDYYYTQEYAAWHGHAGDPGPSQGAFVSTEKRKLFIKNIAYKASESEVRKMIREAAGSDAECIQDIDLPKDTTGGLKYTAFVLFTTPDAARAVQRRLHQKTFKGRCLMARLTAEGASAAETSTRGGPVPGGRHPQGKHKDFKDREKDKDRSKHGPSSKPGPSSCRDKKDRGKERDDDKDRDRGRDRHRGRERGRDDHEEVVIADGSSKHPMSL